LALFFALFGGYNGPLAGAWAKACWLIASEESYLVIEVVFAWAEEGCWSGALRPLEMLLLEILLAMLMVRLGSRRGPPEAWAGGGFIEVLMMKGVACPCLSWGVILSPRDIGPILAPESIADI